nr:hypothetical protein [Tanacetum cinerariifolium]
MVTREPRQIQRGFATHLATTPSQLATSQNTISRHPRELATTEMSDIGEEYEVEEIMVAIDRRDVTFLAAGKLTRCGAFSVLLPAHQLPVFRSCKMYLRYLSFFFSFLQPSAIAKAPMALEQLMAEEDSKDKVDDDVADFED